MEEITNVVESTEKIAEIKETVDSIKAMMENADGINIKLLFVAAVLSGGVITGGTIYLSKRVKEIKAKFNKSKTA